MGHYYSNILLKYEFEDPPKKQILRLPSDDFLAKVWHTHIHGIGVTGTHNPLTNYESLPLEFYVKALRESGYSGIYNLELDSKRFSSDVPLPESIYSSIARLSRSISSTEKINEGE